MPAIMFTLPVWLTVVLLMRTGPIFAQLNVDMDGEPAGMTDNQRCFDCHGKKIYSYENTLTGRIERKAMNPNFVFNPTAFYNGVHRHFRCTDCHSVDYEIFPHRAELRLEPIYGCLDCHGGDPAYAHFHFDQIGEAFENSVHAERQSDRFNCWSCHDPHTYKAMTRSGFKITEIVQYHNNMCASCHDNPDRFRTLSDSHKQPLDRIHDFLPNFKLHFNAVRCIDCHTNTKDTLRVAHQILKKEMAVKRCVECHSTNSLLMSTLYKYQNIESRKSLGTFNAVILNEAYVIGANRNLYLNIISIVLFGLTVLGILIHILFRIKKP